MQGRPGDPGLLSDRAEARAAGFEKPGVFDLVGGVRDRGGRVLTTLLNPDLYPGAQVAACYAERWQVEVA